jgi:hypothetical protein
MWSTLSRRPVVDAEADALGAEEFVEAVRNTASRLRWLNQTNLLPFRRT